VETVWKFLWVGAVVGMAGAFLFTDWKGFLFGAAGFGVFCLIGVIYGLTGFDPRHGTTGELPRAQRPQGSSAKRAD
jgi:hypothetical protein